MFPKEINKSLFKFEKITMDLMGGGYFLFLNNFNFWS